MAISLTDRLTDWVVVVFVFHISGKDIGVEGARALAGALVHSNYRHLSILNVSGYGLDGIGRSFMMMMM